MTGHGERPFLFVKVYGPGQGIYREKEAIMKTDDKSTEAYRLSHSQERLDMWLMHKELRSRFDEIENRENTPLFKYKLSFFIWPRWLVSLRRHCKNTCQFHRKKTPMAPKGSVGGVKTSGNPAEPHAVIGDQLHPSGMTGVV